MNNDLISRSALKKYKFTTQIANGVELEDIEVVPLGVIDNAPTVEPDVNCSHCDYFKSSRSFIENLVGVMLEHEIYTVDDLMTELNHINELNRVKDELGGKEQ